ncbi:DUF1292 domain-containing protein [Bacillaceae bacterium S4-13-58]
MQEEVVEYIIIEDEEGNEEEYEVDAIIEMNGNSYILFSEEDDLEIRKLVDDDGYQMLEQVSDSEIDQIMSAYEEALKEEK